MIRDEDLKSSVDYTEGQREAAHRVLVELINLFDVYKGDIRIVGGWVPDLMFPNEGHIAGSVDVSDFMDLLDDDEIEMVKRDAYEQVQALLQQITNRHTG